MKFTLLMAAGMPLLGTIQAATRSGKAEVELIGSSAYAAGKPVSVGIRMKLDPGWHSYWINPGEGGMALKATWMLPEGWQAGPLKQPVPMRFMTGDLPGFGYEGEAVFIVDLTPPATATGTADVQVKLSWLTCDSSACIPGDADLSLALKPGDPKEGAETVTAALKKIPVPLPGSSLAVEEKEGQIRMLLKLPEGLEGTGISAYPATPQAIDAGARLEFRKHKEGWVCTAKKNEYAEGAVKALELVLAGGNLPYPVTVSWQSEE